MKCPICKINKSKTIETEEKLFVEKCIECEGVWIQASNYWRWIENHEGTPEKEAKTTREVIETKKPKFCPECNHFLTKYKVGHGVSFSLDRCGHCNGVWLDKNEWEELKERNLHDEIHFVFTQEWQKSVQVEYSKNYFDKVYRERFGDSYEKIKEIREWVYGKPNSSEILAFLSDHDPYKV